MKKIILFSLAILTLAGVSFYSCKKGPEDPFLSFSSRKSRVSGTWKVTEYTVNDVDSLNVLISKTIPADPTCGSATAATTHGLSIIYDFNKNGSYSTTVHEKLSTNLHFLSPPTGSNCPDVSATLLDTTTVTKGLWQFGGGVGAYKDKEQLILTDGEDHVFGTTYDIIECKKKELKLQVAVTNKINGLVNIYKWTLQPNK